MAYDVKIYNNSSDPRKVHKSLTLLKTYSDLKVTSENGVEAPTLKLEMFTFYKGSLPHQSTFFKRGLFSKEQYDEDLKVVSDWKFYIKAIIEDGCSVSYYNNVICRKDPIDGVGYLYVENANKEKKEFLTKFLPIGIRKHYETLTKIDSSTYYKFLEICDSPRSLRFLTITIKIIYRLILKTKQ